MASDGPASAPVVLLDANLLYPFHVRNLFIQLGVERLIEVRWTQAIHAEWIGHLVADGRVTRERLARTLALMCRVLPQAEMRGYEHRIDALVLPDADDRHVLAAAIEARASALLTFNLADFPLECLAPHGMIARHPDDFLCSLYDADPEAIMAVVQKARQNLRLTVPSWTEFVETLARQRLVGLAGLLVEKE